MDVAGDRDLLAQVLRRQAPYAYFFWDMGGFAERR